METLKEYVDKRLNNYNLDEQATIKVVLEFLKADTILVSDYCKFGLKKDINETSSKELIKYMISNSPFGYSIRKKKYKAEPIIKKKILSFNEEFEQDEIYE